MVEGVEWKKKYLGVLMGVFRDNFIKPVAPKGKSVHVFGFSVKHQVYLVKYTVESNKKCSF